MRIMGTVGEERKEEILVLVRTLRSLGRSYTCNLTVIPLSLSAFWPDMITVNSIVDHKAGLRSRCYDRTSTNYTLLVASKLIRAPFQVLRCHLEPVKKSRTLSSDHLPGTSYVILGHGSTEHLSLTIS